MTTMTTKITTSKSGECAIKIYLISGYHIWNNKNEKRSIGRTYYDEGADKADVIVVDVRGFGSTLIHDERLHGDVFAETSLLRDADARHRSRKRRTHVAALLRERERGERRG